MLCGGDEYGRTQQGNNNAYCQDNEISWTNWDWDQHAKQLHRFTSRLIHLRREHPIFRRPKFFQGRKIRGSDIKDIMWFNPGGTEMGDEEWETSFVRTLGVMLSGDTIDVLDFYCRSIQDETYLMLFNAHHEPVKFVLPGQEEVRWELIIDTRLEEGFLEESQIIASSEEYELGDRSFSLLRLRAGDQSHARSGSWKKRDEKLGKSAGSWHTRPACTLLAASSTNEIQRDTDIRAQARPRTENNTRETRMRCGLLKGS